MTKHVETRSKLRNISSVDEFESLLSRCVLSDKERKVISLYYLKGKTLGYIADLMGYSISTVKRIHSRSLERLAYLLDD